MSVRDSSRKTPWDYVHETCPDNRELNKMMKEAFDREEKERAQVSACATIQTTTSSHRVLEERALPCCQSVHQNKRVVELFDKGTTLAVIGDALCSLL